TIAFESLDNLVRGGRLSKGKALFVNALGIKLMLNVLDGEMNVQGKIRGTKKMVKAMIEQFDSIPKKEGEPIILVELENEDIYLPIKEYLENNNIEYLKLPLGCSVAIHSGPKVCALFYVEEY
ncbi:DegV family protein, partial [Clostridium perfringens]